MDAREVTHVSKNEDGTIQAIGNPGKKWSPRSKEAAIRDIDRNVHGYYVKRGADEVGISVVHTGGKYLRTDPDPSVLDNLASLPELFVDDFVVGSGKLIVSDPCYTRDIAPFVAMAKNGIWRATVEITEEGRTLLATCEKEEPVGEMEEFEVGVDSAQAGIFCDSVYPSKEDPNPEFYRSCCDATQTGASNAGIIMMRGVVSTAGDDGCYRAFVGRNKEGFAVAVRIEFN